MQENIKEQIIKTLQTAFKPYVRHSVQLTPLAQSPQYPWSSKFGGIPYWPLGMDYPKTNDGEKLLLLAQLNFSELPHIQNYPQDGLLQFFVADDDLYGCDFEKPSDDANEVKDGYRVVYHASIMTELDKLEPDLPEASIDHDLPLAHEFSLLPSLKLEYPAPSDFVFKKLFPTFYEADDGTQNIIYEQFQTTGCKVGGFAYFAQEDPRDLEDDEDWVLLFQMDSEGGTQAMGKHEIMWGDVGVANFFIRRDALKKLDFSQVWYNWDCC